MEERRIEGVEQEEKGYNGRAKETVKKWAQVIDRTKWIIEKEASSENKGNKSNLLGVAR